MASGDLRAALIGFGLAGEAFHAPLINAVEGIELAAIVSGDEERRSRATERYPDVLLLAGSAELWDLAGDFDLAVVAAPNQAHVPLAEAALDAGLPVVVDKPLAPTAGEARTLVAKARETGLALIPFHNRRWDGDFLTVRRLRSEGKLGPIWRFESRFERWRPQIAEGWRESAEPADAGGVLYDLGSHLVDQALVLCGPVRSVYSELDTRREGAQVDDDAFVALTHRSGVRTHLWMSVVAGQPGPRFRVLGERAAYVKHGLDVQEAELRAGREPSEPGWGREDAERWGLVGTESDTRSVETEPGAYQRFYEGVVATLREGAPPPVDADDAVAGLALLEAARVSSAERRVVEVDPT
jgi:scyllo-inositol 2-dehydrogenase (NADP+)